MPIAGSVELVTQPVFAVVGHVDPLGEGHHVDDGRVGTGRYPGRHAHQGQPGDVTSHLSCSSLAQQRGHVAASNGVTGVRGHGGFGQARQGT